MKSELLVDDILFYVSGFLPPFQNRFYVEGKLHTDLRKELLRLFARHIPTSLTESLVGESVSFILGLPNASYWQPSCVLKVNRIMLGAQEKVSKHRMQ